MGWRGGRSGLALLGLLVWLGLSVALLIADPRPLQALRLAVFDQYQRWHPRVYQDTAVRVIDLDEESLARFGQWPWPRTRLAELVHRFEAAQAAAIGFDVVFAEPDRTSPRAMASLWQLPSVGRALLAGLPDHDAAFADALRGSHAVLGLSMRTERPSAEAVGSQTLPQSARFVEMGPAATAAVPEFAGILPALPALAGAAAGNGALVFLPDPDGVVRRVPLVLRAGGQLVPTLAAEMLRVGQGQTNYLLRGVDSAGGGLAEVRIGQMTLPTTPRGELWVHYTGAAPLRTIPAWQVLEGRLPAEALRGRLLLVGSSAQGLLDLRFSPLGTVVPGVEVHAQVLEQALTDAFLYRPGWAHAIEILAVAVGGLLVGGLALTTGPAVSVAATALLIAAMGWGGWTAFVDHRLLLDPLTPALGVFLAFLLPSLLRHHASEQRRRWVSQAFSRYVSPNRVAHIVEHPEELQLGGDRRECSFIFTDLAGFTALMEKIDPGQAVGLLNAYLDGMIAIAFRHQGTLDRIVGDAVAIMFSAPVAQADHRQRAFDCALAMQRFATDFARRQHAAGLAFGRTRIGVHSGEVIVGNFGGSTMFDYRALGDAVNTAARLESVNKHLGTWTCLSEATLAGCAGAAVRPVGRLVLKGKTEPLSVYQPLNDGLDGASDPERLRAYEAAYALMAASSPEALPAFEALAADDAADPLVQLHLGRLRGGVLGDLLVMEDK
ncbi:adenylate/guanylate cyclase domain-containing protein [Rhodoferax koreense]|uniref:Adenylate/guanylate cyclase domain-containing protein n=2 Tax=Rhodoferax koreensis TaxID=1842727 RepID=A0A1P8K497_9BURK|nr:adenylate/guanylate cyclase domain-containing protein [Rhodoferax koreense]